MKYKCIIFTKRARRNFIFRDSKHTRCERESLISERSLKRAEKPNPDLVETEIASETRISQLRELRVNCSARFRVRFSTPFKQDRTFIVRPLILFPPPSRDHVIADF